MKTIAISGKGGTGKTTLAALIIQWLSKQAKKPILAVDADPNVNLNDLLGVELKDTIGAIREEMKTSSDNLPAGMTKQQFLEYKIQTSLVETSDFDLIAMGRPEGPGCYCYANNLLRDIVKTLCTNYQYIVIDNEAGMEHLSRRTVQNIDYLLIISDPLARGIRAAGKISRLLKELNTRIKEKYLILNRVQNSIPQQINKTIKDEKLKLLHLIPEDERLFKLDQSGKPIYPATDDSPAYKAVGQLMKKLINF
ncbi:MAG: AAA family ATPase [Candidatus Aminicenantes bacterium]|nr:AAA family ATPase [Candidatus Aminicenantes bacterium]